ncbi:MAG TPA: biotin--[acetyl-CoA-carboxylase] ligase [Solirubrobacteraceae bacterium]|nr:biotin--[acetyl-CoA-carboxylase] ligase [Solirubrobacteraceae bacterium]
MSAPALGYPRLHFRLTDSTNARGRELAVRGAPHGTVVTAAEQSAGRGRHGRTWSAPARRALLCSVVIRDPPRLLPLVAGVAVAEMVGPDASIKWPNDVLVDGRKVAGILVEGRLQEGWAVVGIGVNVALRLEDFPPELHDRAGTLGFEPGAIEPTLWALLRELEVWLAAGADAVLEAVRARDTLLGREVRWAGGAGMGAGIDGDGRLLVRTDAGLVALDAGEVHLGGA